MLTADQLDYALCAGASIPPDAWTNAISAPGRAPKNTLAKKRQDRRTHPYRWHAREICAVCPLREACADAGGYGKAAQEGLWGGLDEEERGAMEPPETPLAARLRRSYRDF